jgi:hypothetical protein
MSKKYIISMTLCLGLFVLAGADYGSSRENYSSAAEDQAQNKAARITIVKSGLEQEAAGHLASAGLAFLVVETEWENIHPKQKVDKAKLEGKTDRTMGVGGLGGGKKQKTEYVDVDVAYQIPKLFDHAYLLADGLAIALSEATEDISGGFKLQERFTIAKLGEVRKVTLVYSVPEASKNLAFQLFDYQYGHVVVPVKGNVKAAKGTGKPPGKSLDTAHTDKIEFASLGLQTQPQYMGQAAPTGWTYAVALLVGKSLSGGSVKDIVQIKPEEYTWITTDGGYLYACSGSATAVTGVLRFTPEIYQMQELAFLVPDTDTNFRLSVRVQNQVLAIDLGTKSPQGLPSPKALHKDGSVMEILVFGMRQDQGKVVVDLGIRSLYDRGGIDIQMKQQFFLQLGEAESSVDAAATAALLRHPPVPFTVPPGASLRFELAFDAQGTATALRYRGYESEAVLKF